jgi:energy-coupling factor transporter ATP-binding protein EcfA2
MSEFSRQNTAASPSEPCWLFQRLELRNYRCFEQHALIFHRGLNIILGPNESGKSTLLNALLDALYANPFSTASELAERISFGSAAGWSLLLELQAGGKRLRLSKRYSAEDPTRRSECWLATLPSDGHGGGEGEKQEGKEALRGWEQCWAVPREVYLATACIRQRELSAIVSDKKSLASLQQQLREAALATDLERILKQIQEHGRELRRRHEQLRQQRETIMTRLHTAQQQYTRLQEYRQRLQPLTEQIAQRETQIDEMQHLLQRWQAVNTLQKEWERVHEETEQLRRVLDAFENLEREQQRLQAELEQARSEAEQRIGQLRRTRTWLGIAGGALMLTGISLITVNGLLGGTLAALGGLLLLFALIWRAGRGQGAESRQQQLQQQLEQLRLQREGLLQAHSPDELRQRWGQLAVQQHALKTKLDEEPLARQLLEGAEEWLRRERQLERLLQEQERDRQEKLRLEGALQQLTLEHDPDELHLQLEQLGEQIDYLQRRIQVMECTQQLLKEANQRYLDDLSPRLAPRIELYLPALTCGRYTQIQMGDGLLFQVYHPDAGKWLDADPSESGWSAGTLDQIFFACRLGLADALMGHRRLPLLLDDPFLYFDEARLQAAMELLSRVAQHVQVLLFTCRPPASLPPDASLIELPPPS